MLVELCSVEIFQSKFNDIRENSANLLYVYATNNFNIYRKFCQCAIHNELSALMPELVIRNLSNQ